MAQRPIVSEHVSIIDGSDALPRADQTAMIRGNRIVSVTAGRAARQPGDAQVVDGGGKFLIPRLIVGAEYCLETGVVDFFDGVPEGA